VGVRSSSKLVFSGTRQYDAALTRPAPPRKQSRKRPLQVTGNPKEKKKGGNAKCERVDDHSWATGEIYSPREEIKPAEAEQRGAGARKAVACVLALLGGSILFLRCKKEKTAVRAKGGERKEKKREKVPPELCLRGDQQN